MRIAARAIIITTGVVGLIGSALAADMTGADIKAFLSGKTAYLETTAASASGVAGQVVIYWAGGWHGPLQDAVGSHDAWQMGDQGQHAVHRLEGTAEHWVRAL
jgi:hypothetical protein